MRIVMQNIIVRPCLAMCLQRYLPLFVHKEKNGGKAGNEKCHYDRNYDDQVKCNSIVCCQKEENDKREQQ